MKDLIPFIIIITFPIVLFLIFKLIRKNKRLLFLFDDKLLKSPIKLSTLLLAVALFYIVYSYLIHLIFGVSDPSDYIWNIVGLLMSASHFVKTKGADTNYLILYIFTMLIGLFVYGIFISNLVGYVKEKLKKLSKGRTKIIEENHILIIGVSEYLYPIIDQYIEASLKAKGKHFVNLMYQSKLTKQKIVILSDESPESIMGVVEQRAMALKSKDYTNTMKKKYLKELQRKLIYRTGLTYSIHDLNMCNIEAAQSVIVLGSDQDKIKSILAIGATNFKGNEDSFVISKFNETEMLSIAERNDLSDEYDLIDINHLIANLTAQTTIQPNLSYIYNDLLDFNKTSIEFIKVVEHPELRSLLGKTFDEASLALTNVILLGIKNNKITINPNADSDITIKETDSMIIIRNPEVNMEVNLNTSNLIDHEIINSNDYEFIKEDLNFIIMGYSENINRILTEFNRIISNNSNVTLLFDSKYESKIKIDKVMNNLNIDFGVNYFFYDNFETFSKLISEFDSGNDIDSIIILPNQFLSKKQQDDESIITLQNLKYLEKVNNRDYNITVDLVEMSNQNIIEHMNIADVIISDKFSSELIFQYATHRDIKVVYDELFSTDGDEIYSIPLSNYISNFDKAINFYTLSKAALNKDQIAIGYKHNNEVVILTNNKEELVSFSSTDHIIVIAKGHE